MNVVISYVKLSFQLSA